MRAQPWVLCLLLLAADPAAGQGQLFINFDDCSAVSPPKTKFLDCASTTATTVIASVMTTNDLDGIVADLGFADVVVGFDPVGMPDFWQFQASGCGAGNLLLSNVFESSGWSTCLDLWSGLGGSGGQYGGIAGPNPDGNRARIKWTASVAPPEARSLPALVEAYVCRMTFRQAHLTTCPTGCDQPVCVIFLQESFWLLGGGTYDAYSADYCIFNSYLDLLDREHQVNLD